MIHRNGSFIVGYMAGRNDRTQGHPYNNWGVENLTPEYLAGYLAGFTGKGSVVIEMPDEIPERLSVGDRVKHRNQIYNFVTGIVQAIGTELGPDYASVKWSEEGFFEQLRKESLVKVD